MDLRNLGLLVGVASVIGAQSKVVNNTTYNDITAYHDNKDLTADAYKVLTTPGTLSSFSSSGSAATACNGANLNWAGSVFDSYTLCIFTSSDGSDDSLYDIELISSVSSSQDIAEVEYTFLIEFEGNYFGTICYDPSQSCIYSSAICTNLLLVSTTPSPTAVPTTVSTAVPTAVPTTVPTAIPTTVPTTVPTAVPTAVPTTVPTYSYSPSIIPTVSPSVIPTFAPSIILTQTPSFVHIGSTNVSPTAGAGAEKKSMSTGEIVGIAVGVAATMAAVGLFAYNAYKKHMQKQDNKDHLLDNDFNL